PIVVENLAGGADDDQDGDDYWDDNRSSGTGDQFLAAMKLADENKNDEALAALDKLEKEGHGAYPVLARMRAATVQVQK
ncbi:hypothetical protein AB9F40_34635, partial [Rhizobium leguminosarum]